MGKGSSKFLDFYFDRSCFFTSHIWKFKSTQLLAAQHFGWNKQPHSYIDINMLPPPLSGLTPRSPLDSATGFEIPEDGDCHSPLSPTLTAAQEAHKNDPRQPRNLLLDYTHGRNYGKTLSHIQETLRGYVHPNP